MFRCNTAAIQLQGIAIHLHLLCKAAATKCNQCTHDAIPLQGVALEMQSDAIPLQYVLYIRIWIIKSSKMSSEFISINDAAAKYQVSQNKVRRLVKESKGTKHVKAVGIKGKHGFKYLVSVAYLSTIFNPNHETSDHRAEPKQEINLDNQNSQNDNQLIIQITSENKRLNKQINSQNQIIDKLTDTISEQNKVIISQSMQVHHLTERTTTERPPEEPQNNLSFGSKLETILIILLVGCMVALTIYLFS